MPKAGAAAAASSEPVTQKAAVVITPPAPMSGPADDLKRISGIGPWIERQLNAMGITRFAQIATWSAEDIARIGAEVAIPGRIERDGWVEQARRLAAETAHGQTANGTKPTEH